MNGNLKHSLDRVVENGSVQLQAIKREQLMRQGFGLAVVMCLVVPAVAIVFQLIRLQLGLPAGFGFSWRWWIGLTIVFPVIWLLARTMSTRIDVARRGVLGRMDAQLGSSERLVTADEFLGQPNSDGFKRAAMEDAAEWATRARDEALRSDQQARTNSARSFAAVPIALLLLGIAAWLATFSHPANSGTDRAAALVDAEPEAHRPEAVRTNIPTPVEEETESESRSEPKSDRRGKRRTNRQGTAAVVTPDQAELSRGQLTDGETSESQQSSNPSSAKGEPSSSGQPSKSQSEVERKPKKPRARTEDKEREQKKRDEAEEPSGSTAGQGSSRGSNNNAASSDWSSKSPAAAPEDEEIEEEDDVDDEDEEQKSRGGVQPNMRDRRTPVNRDLQIGFGSNRPNPDANGRGGPGGQKKSRGVASLVLGVPIPDRITGQPNKGRIRITQQRITPEAEQSDPSVAQSRGSRNAAVGPIHHPDLTPWLHDVVRRYFLDRRNATPLNRSVESDDPQS